MDGPEFESLQWEGCSGRDAVGGNFLCSKSFPPSVKRDTLDYPLWKAKRHNVTTSESFICSLYQPIRLLHATGLDSEQVEGVIE